MNTSGTYTYIGNNTALLTPSGSGFGSSSSSSNLQVIVITDNKFTIEGAEFSKYTSGPNLPGSGKPANLSNNATYNEAFSKLDEIISYCNSNSNSTNSAIKNYVDALKITMQAPMYNSNWSYYQSSTISTINGYISQLQDNSGVNLPGGGGSKPTTLSSGASYNEADAKLDEIIAYCNSNSNTTNDSIKGGAIAYKNTISSYSSYWSGMQSQAVSTINTYIGSLN